MTGHTDKSPADIAQDLRDLSETMLDRAADLDYYGGMNKQWTVMARWLIQVSAGVLFLANSLISKEPK